MGCLSLQMILPWCLPAGARRRSPVHPPAAHAGGVRLIGSDGRVRVYHRPIAAAELMGEHPCHLVCRSDAFFIGQKVPPLAAGDQLQPGHSYFLLPSHFFHSVLSFVTLATSLVGAPSSSAAAAAAGRKRAALARPFDIRKTAAGTLQVRVSDEFLMERGQDEEIRGKVVTTAAMAKEYSLLVRSKSWKWTPKLEAIEESPEKRRRSTVGRLDGRFAFKRRKKTTRWRTN